MSEEDEDQEYKPGFDWDHNGTNCDILFDVCRTVHAPSPQRRFIVPINDV